MKKLGFLVDNLNPSQLAYLLIRNINDYLEENRDYDIVLFFENLVRPCITPKCSIFPAYCLFDYDGPVIATTANGIEKLVNCTNVKNKFFYVWDLEWTRNHVQPERFNYEYWRNVYRHPDVSIITRSLDHQKIVENNWNRPVLSTVEQCKVNDFVGLMEALNSK